MSTMYDISDANMKLGVAFPVLNDSFKYWDNPGTWNVPTKWTLSNLSVSRNFTGFDDDAALQLTASAPPASLTHYAASVISQYWPDSRALPAANMTVYYSWAGYAIALTGGASIVMWLQVDNAEAFSSPSASAIGTIAATGSELAIVSGTSVITNTTADRWARVLASGWNGTVASGVVDCIGVMFNPFDTGAGYYELTGVRSVTGPSREFLRFTQRDTTRQGVDRRYDPSGGAEKRVMRVQLDREDIALVEMLKKFYDLNHGTPGVPGVPLLLEPNVPGFPPTMLCNIDDQAFPLDKQGNLANFWDGTITFRAVY